MDKYKRPDSAVSIVAWFLAVASLLAVAVRISTKVAVSRKLFSGDDAAVLAALLFSIAQTVAVSIEASNGLGRHIDSLSQNELIRFQKSAYASKILLIASLIFSKLSVLLLIEQITPVVMHRRVARGTVIATIIWGSTALCVAVFQCAAPETWRSLGIDSRCINMTAFWNYVGISNILLDAALILIPFGVFWGLHVSKHRRAVASGCFATRATAIGAMIAFLYFSNVRSSPYDPTFNSWTTALCTQVVQSLSIVSACVPNLKPFLDSVESGMLRSDDIRRRGGDKSVGHGSKESYNLSDTSAKKHAWRPANAHGAISPQVGGAKPLGPDASNVVIASGGQDDLNGWDAESQQSSSRIIKTTRTFAVE